MKLSALYKHWCTADSVKQFIAASVPIGSPPGLSEDRVQAAQAHSSFMRLSVTGHPKTSHPRAVKTSHLRAPQNQPLGLVHR